MRRIILSFALALLGLALVASSPASARHCFRHYTFYRTYHPYRYASYPWWWSNPYRYTAWNSWNRPYAWNNGWGWGGGLLGGAAALAAAPVQLAGAAVAAPFQVAGAATGAALAAPYNVAYNTAPLMTGRSVAVAKRICTGRSVYYRNHHRYFRHVCRYY